MNTSTGKTCAKSLIHLHTFTHCDTTGLLRILGKFDPSNCSIRQKPSKIHCPNYEDTQEVPAMLDEEECGGSSCSNPIGEMW